MFSKKQVNHAQASSMITVLEQAASTPSREEQDTFIAQLDVMVDELDNKATLRAFRDRAPRAYVAVEAAHLAVATGDSPAASAAKMKTWITANYGTGKRYEVFWSPYPSHVMSELRKVGDYMIDGTI